MEILMKENLHTEALTKEARSVYKILHKQSFLKDFYLAGRTGLALQIGHRISQDFDFFSNKEKLTRNSRERIVRYLSDLGKVEVELEEEGTLRIYLNRIGISFFHYDYSLITPLLHFGNLRIVSITDIGLMKIAAIVGRGSKKDFIDLYFIANHHIPLDNLLRLSRKKFPTARDFPMQALRALVYFKDAEREKMPKMIQKLRWKDVKEFFTKEVERISKKWIEI
jgi:predicted nucleotidyltransferase component of viral defense system